MGSSQGLLKRLGIGVEDPVIGDVGEVLAYVKADDWMQLRLSLIHI